MLPQYHSASCRLDDGSTDSDWAIRSWDNANAPRSCLISEPDRLRTTGVIAAATSHQLTLHNYDLHTHTHTQPFYCSSGICPGPPGWAGIRKVKPGRLKPIWIYWSKRQKIKKNKIKIKLKKMKWMPLTGLFSWMYCMMYQVPKREPTQIIGEFFTNRCPLWNRTNFDKTLRGNQNTDAIEGKAPKNHMPFPIIDWHLKERQQ